jgi:hypothetical protein
MGLRASLLIGYLVLAIALASAQQTAPPQTGQTPAAPPIIKSQVRVVLLDSVVTDRKGNYVRDLTVKDFKVWEDNKEQQITSFSTGDDPAAPGEKKVDISVPNADFSIQKGSLVVRLGLQLPMTSLTPGQYQLQLGAADSAGHASDYRISDFEIE